MYSRRGLDEFAKLLRIGRQYGVYEAFIEPALPKKDVRKVDRDVILAHWA